MEEQYLVLSTTVDQRVVNKACAVLEEHEIPVMIEHIQLKQGREQANGYRILVPSHLTQKAMKLYTDSSKLN